MLLNLTHIGQIALPVSDVDRSEAFYKDVLGLPKLFRFGHPASAAASWRRLWRISSI